MGRIAFVVLLIGILAAPTAFANDPFADKQCLRADQCIGPGTCTDNACIPRGCAEILQCRGSLDSASQCATNATIAGHTCQFLAGAGIGSGSDDLWVGATTSDGTVNTFNLPNTWTSSAVDAHARVGTVSTGDITVSAYQSTILTPGPRGGLLALASPDPNHEWRTIGVNVHKGSGTTSGEDVLVGVLLLDSVPETCYVRTGLSSVFTCPRLSQSLP